MKFRITLHSRHNAPSDAIEQLWARLESLSGEASFSKVRAEIRATWGEAEGARDDREARIEAGRLSLLDLLREVCDTTPDLELDWYAITSTD